MLLMVFGTASFAQTEFDFDTNGTTLLGLPGESSGSGATAVTDGDITEAVSATVGDVTVTVSAGEEGKTVNRLWNKSPKLRMYSGTLTVKSAGSNITSIAIALASTKSATKWGADNAANVGTLALDESGISATWTGEASEVVITIAANTQISKLTVNTGGEVTPPEPVEIPEVANIAAFKALDNGKEAKLTLANAKVLYAAGDDVYVKDATGAIDFYKTGLTLSAGQLLNGTVTAKYTLYNNLPELTATSNTKADDITITEAAAAEPTVVSLVEAKDAKYACDLIKLQNVTIGEKDGNIYAIVGNDSLQIYDKFKLNKGTVKFGETRDVTGILVPYKDIFELYNIEDISDGVVPTVTIADIHGYTADKAGIELKLTNAQVVFVDGKNVYVREAGKAIMFYNTNLALPMNAVLNGTLSVDYDNYNGLHEVKDNANSNLDNVEIDEDADDAEPISATVEEILALNYMCDLVKLTNVQVVADGSNYYAVQGENRVQLYSRSRASLYNTGLDTTKTYDIVALFNAIYKGAAEIDPVQITENTTGVADIRTNAQQRGTVYNLAGQRLQGLQKGLNIVDGKKVVLK